MDNVTTMYKSQYEYTKWDDKNGIKRALIFLPFIFKLQYILNEVSTAVCIFKKQIKVV